MNDGRCHACGIVDDRRDRRKTHLGLARQRHLGYQRRPDDVGAVALQAADFGRRLEARPFHAGEHTAIENPIRHAVGRGQQGLPHLRTERFGHVDADPAFSVIEQRQGARLGAIEEVVRDHHVARTQDRVDRTDRVLGDDALHAKFMQGPDVGAVVDLVAGDGQLGAVAQ